MSKDLPDVSLQIAILNPKVIVVDMTMPGPDGQPIPVKGLKFIDNRSGINFDVPLTLELAAIVGEQLLKQPSGIQRVPSNFDLSKLKG